MTTSKLMWNSVISTQNARYMCAYTANFYLATPLDMPEYMQINAKLVPQVCIDANILSSKIYKGFIYMKLVRGMYGLPQAGILGNKLLKKRLKEYAFFEVPHTPGLFTHKARPIWFTLCVDDFGVKYVGKEHADYLMSVLKQFFTMEEDWKGALYRIVHMLQNQRNTESWRNILRQNLTVQHLMQRTRNMSNKL